MSLSLNFIHLTYALLELDFCTSFARVVGPPAVGLPGLEKLSMGWNAKDNPNEPRSSLAHLYELIWPTLTTLVELRLNTRISLGVFDLQRMTGGEVTRVVRGITSNTGWIEITILGVREGVL